MDNESNAFLVGLAIGVFVVVILMGVLISSVRADAYKDAYKKTCATVGGAPVFDVENNFMRCDK
jgi:hypothetical protein